VLLAVIIYFVTPTRDLIASGAVIVGAIFFGIYAARRPRQLPFRVNDDGVSIGQKFHGYEEFRSFTVVPEGSIGSIIFMPLKRFSPSLTIYYEPDIEDSIMNELTERIPLAEHAPDIFDRLLRLIKF
jgi:hypothetical protein